MPSSSDSSDRSAELNQHTSSTHKRHKNHREPLPPSSVPPRPDSPFFRPSTVKPVTLTKVLSTPKGTRLHSTQTEKLLLNRNGATDQLEKKSSLIGTYANLVNAIVGAGIIGIPYAMKETGIVAGLILTFATSLLTDKSLRMLIGMGKHVSVQSYETLLEAAFGRKGFVFISLNMLLMGYGAMIAYLLVLKDTFPIVLGIADDDEQSKRIVLLVSSLAVILPLSLQRDMADLSKTSTISVMFDICLVVIVAFCSPVQDSIEAAGGIDFIWEESLVRPSTLFVGLGVLSFAFVCQDSSFIIAGSLHQPTKERWGAVSRSSLLTCAALSTIIGVTGYLGFLGDTQGNILNNFTDQDISPDLLAYGFVPVHTAIIIAKGLLGATMFCVYPLASYVARHALVVLLFEGRQAHEGDDHTILARKDRRVVMTLTLYIAALLPAIMFEDVGTVLAVTGAVAGSCLSYLGPGAAFLGVHGKHFLNNVANWEVSREEQLIMWKYPVGRKVENVQSVGIIAQLFNALLWYCSCMPLWCAIASTGEHNIEVFQKEQLAKSPAFQRRLGKMIQKKGTGASLSVQKGGQITLDDIMTPFGRANSFDTRSQYDCEHNQSSGTESSERFPLLSKTVLIPPSGSDSSIYGTGIDNTDKTNHSNASTCDSIDDEAVEEDTQEDPPTTGDFLLAISYMVLGAIALCAGLISISAS